MRFRTAAAVMKRIVAGKSLVRHAFEGFASRWEVCLRRVVSATLPTRTLSVRRRAELLEQIVAANPAAGIYAHAVFSMVLRSEVGDA